MAAWVTLKNGKVLQYNKCRSIMLETKIWKLRYEKHGGLIAAIPVENIERFEFDRPYKVYREPRKDKLPVLK